MKVNLTSAEVHEKNEENRKLGLKEVDKQYTTNLYIHSSDIRAMYVTDEFDMLVKVNSEWWSCAREEETHNLIKQLLS
ncbi:hypothetical protein KAU11_10525 [Candidatus Babeliales bacterium]|nr:hypothetical protein [Candidatus Babeliales bacterium]